MVCYEGWYCSVSEGVVLCFVFLCFQAEDGIRDLVRSRGLGDVYKRQVLDVGSSTGGFTKFALEKGAKKVIAVEIGTDQMDYSLVQDKRVKLYEKIDIFNVITKNDLAKLNKKVIQSVDVAVVDVSFLSCREVLVCLLYTSDAADERFSVDLGGRRIIKKKKN